MAQRYGQACAMHLVLPIAGEQHVQPRLFVTPQAPRKRVRIASSFWSLFFDFFGAFCQYFLSRLYDQLSISCRMPLGTIASAAEAPATHLGQVVRGLRFAVSNRGMRFAVCRLRFGVWRFAACGLGFAVCGLRFEVCAFRFAVGGLQFAVCGLLLCG